LLVEEQIKHYQSLDKWFQTPLGHYVAQQFTTELNSFEQNLKGDTLIQLGCCGDNPWLSSLQYQKQWIISPYQHNQKQHLVSALHQLPFAKNSLDCVVVPLSLEPFKNSYTLLDEIDRVLTPMGFAIFLSISPWSAWGAAMKSGLLRCYQNNKVRMHSALSLNRIMLQRGYRQCALGSFCYIPPVNNASWIKRMTFLDEVGKMVWPFPAGVYSFIAQKYQLITPNLTLEAQVSLSNKEYESPLQPAIKSYSTISLDKDLDF
jgi:hypothetical protein